MKKIVYLLLAAVGALSVSGCSERDIDMDTNGGQGLEFLHFASSTGSVLATEDDAASRVFTMTVGITSSSDKDRTYNVKLGSATTGVENTDFTMPVKTLTIPANKFTATTSFEIDYDNITPAGFVVELVLDVEGGLINPAFGDSCLVTVKSDKVVIDWEWLLGAWTAGDVDPDGVLDGGNYSVQISRKGEDSNQIVISNLWGSGVGLNGTVDLEARTISIDPGQIIYNHASYGDFYCAFADISGADPVFDYEAPVTGTLSAMGIDIGPWGVSNDIGFFGVYKYSRFTR